MWQSQFKNMGIKTLNFAIFEKYIYLPILVTAPGNIEIFKSFLQIYLRELVATFTSADRKKRGKFSCACLIALCHSVQRQMSSLDLKENE